MHILKRPAWSIPERLVTDERFFLNRRKFLKTGAAIGGAAALGAFPRGRAEAAVPGDPYEPKPTLNSLYADAGRAVTDETVNGTYNNFYEFASHKNIWEMAQALDTEGWTVTLDGLVENAVTLDMDGLLKRVTVEERIYRHRCVEAWSMVAPWIGFPLRDLVSIASPLSSAKYVRFETFLNPDVAPGQKQFWYPWPYIEGVTMAEAENELAFMVTGAYGKVLAKQFGAPIRLHLPWKYGFKSIKSIVRVSFTEERPVGLWEELQAAEYGFWANVNPEVAHPRWSQATERVLGGDGERIPTLIFNGYGDQVAHLYTGMEGEVGDRLWR